GQALAGFTLFDAMDQTVNTVAVGAEGEEGTLVQQAGQIEIRALADQLDVEAIGLADGLAAVELEHLQVMLDALDAQAEMGFVGRVEHMRILSKESFSTACHDLPSQRCRREAGGRRNASSSSRQSICRWLSSKASAVRSACQQCSGTCAGRCSCLSSSMFLACLALSRRNGCCPLASSTSTQATA